MLEESQYNGRIRVSNLNKDSLKAKDLKDLRKSKYRTRIA